MLLVGDAGHIHRSKRVPRNNEDPKRPDSSVYLRLGNCGCSFVIGYIVVVLILSIIFSDRLGGLTVALGVAGAGIAFALQEVIASCAGWFAISFAGFYNPGDRVEVGGIRGDVIDVSFLRTTLMEVGEWVNGDLYTGRLVRVANSFVFKAPVYNYSGDFPFLWDEITVPVKYGSDHRLARKILEDISKDLVGVYSKNAASEWQDFSRRFLLENASTEPMVTLIANDNWIEFTVRYIVDFKKRRVTKDALFTLILDEFEKTDGKVGFASATFQIVETPVFDVRLSNNS
ncbi:MAG: mechanosensitive ion channel [Chloracidobacterium sp.]|nr:mechanosensitive ion channel [Chloracidobacterium sp.]